MDLEFRGDIFTWRGPSPYYFVAVPEGPSELLERASSLVTYGWGMIPVRVRIGGTTWNTSLFPKAGRYLVPLKDRVRKAEGLHEGDVVQVGLEIAP